MHLHNLRFILLLEKVYDYLQVKVLAVVISAAVVVVVVVSVIAGQYQQNMESATEIEILRHRPPLSPLSPL